MNAVAMIPVGRRATFAENVRQVQRAFDFFMAKARDSTLSPPYIENGSSENGVNWEEAIYRLLAETLGVTTAVIGDCRSYGEYLSAEVLEILVEATADEAFFEEAQRRKRTLIKKLRHEMHPEEIITLKVSDAVLKWFTEYRETRKIKATRDIPEERPKGKGEWRASSENGRIVRPQPSFSHWTPQGTVSSDDPPTLTALKCETADVVQRLHEYVAPGRDVTEDKLASVIKQSIFRLAELHAKVLSLTRKRETNPLREVF